MVKPPSKPTLKKYGLTENEWLAILESQDGKCAICRNVPSSGRFVVDHKHVRNYKKLSAERRRELCRGILCWRCNYYFAGKGMNSEWAYNLWQYFLNFETRCPL